MDVLNSSNKYDMNHFSIKIAGLVFGIDAISTGIYGYCIRYLSTEAPIIRVGLSKEELESEVEKNRICGLVPNEIYLESIGIYRKIAEYALSYNILLMHGAVVVHKNQAFMFMASSGIGKTTHVKQWLVNDKDAYILNGDKPLIKIESSDVVACGTPWNGKEGMGVNTMVQLSAIVFLQRNTENIIEEISFKSAYPDLLTHTNRPNDLLKLKRTLDLLTKLKGKVRFYKFYINNFKEDCFNVSFNSLVINNVCSIS